MRTQPLQPVGGFYVLYDEAAEQAELASAAANAGSIAFNRWGGRIDDSWREEYACHYFNVIILISIVVRDENLCLNLEGV